MMKLSTILFICMSSFWGVAEDYDKTKEEIKVAIEDGNFAEVKSLLNELMPELKEDIKEEKSAFQSIKKSGEKAEIEAAKNNLDRKKEIYESLEHLLKVSPAAIRARAGSVVKMLDEYKS